MAQTLPGNLGRNSISGPSWWNYDMSLIKDTQVAEFLKVQFRAEFFNLFNHTQFYNPDGNISDGVAFGRISQARDPRLVQFALKLIF